MGHTFYHFAGSGCDGPVWRELYRHLFHSGGLCVDCLQERGAGGVLYLFEDAPFSQVSQQRHFAYLSHHAAALFAGAALLSGPSVGFSDTAQKCMGRSLFDISVFVCTAAGVFLSLLLFSALPSPLSREEGLDHQQRLRLCMGPSHLSQCDRTDTHIFRRFAFCISLREDAKLYCGMARAHALRYLDIYRRTRELFL